MNISLLRVTLCLFVLGCLLTVTHAQERPATPSPAATSAANEAVLLQKVSYLTQMVKLLEDKLAACAAGQGVTCPSVLPQQGTESSTPASPQGQTHAPTPARRHTVGYQQASDSRLGCEDYSLAYFRRHPAMAAVCGVNAQQQPVAPQPQVQAPVEEEHNYDTEASAQ